jgi:undecaprenyl-phosphate 4-deoxy-4-formamido-L-arabinose transferase
MLTDKLAPGISVVVPVYNSAEMLPDLVRRLELVLSATGCPFELVLVNDGSKDDSWKVIERLASEKPWVRGLGMMRNYGQHNALLAGIRAAKYDLTVTMDDDLQHPPEELPKLLAAMTDDVDVVYAPPIEEQHGILRDIASIVTKLTLQSAMGADNAKKGSAWRAFRTRLRDAFADFRSPLASVDVLLTWGTRRFGFVALRHDPRAAGKSNYTLGKLVRHAFNMMTGFSVLPLQIASLIGFVFTLFGFGVLAYVLIRFMMEGSAVQGFPFLASVVAIFSGAQLFALGIIGEYLARMHFRIMDKPTYVIKESTDTSKSAEK